jgi:hypothetical protein
MKISTNPNCAKGKMSKDRRRTGKVKKDLSQAAEIL